MKILHAIYDSVDNPWLGGGGAQRTQELYKRLTSKHQITVVCGNVPDAQRNIEGVTYVRVGIASNYYLSRLTYLLLAPLVIMRSRADIFIEDVGMPFGLFMAFLKKNARCSVQYIPTAAYAKKRKLVGKLLTVLFRRSLRRYRKFVTVSPYAKQEILAINPDAQVEIIPNGITMPRLAGSTAEYILYLGRIDVYQKGLDVLVAALAELKAGGEPFECLLAGPGEAGQIRALNELIRRHGLEGNVKHIGAVHGAEKHAALLAARMVAIPSRNETFGIVAVEAFSYGKPVVAARVGGLADVVEESAAGLMFEPGDIAQLADGIKRLLHDPALGATMAKRGLDFSRGLSWDNIAQKFDDYLESAL